MFFFLGGLLSFLLYVLGNFQAFLEKTQLLILAITQIVNIVAVVVAIYYLLFLIFWARRRKRTPLRRVLYSVFMLVVNSILASGALLIQAFTLSVS